MFISIEERGKTFIDLVLEQAETRQEEWGLLLSKWNNGDQCYPGLYGCTNPGSYAVMAALLERSEQEVRQQFEIVATTCKPLLLKQGSKEDMKHLWLKLQFYPCQCVFKLDVIDLKNAA